MCDGCDLVQRHRRSRELTRLKISAGAALGLEIYSLDTERTSKRTRNLINMLTIFLAIDRAKLKALLLNSARRLDAGTLVETGVHYQSCALGNNL